MSVEARTLPSLSSPVSVRRLTVTGSQASVETRFRILRGGSGSGPPLVGGVRPRPFSPPDPWRRLFLLDELQWKSRIL